VVPAWSSCHGISCSRHPSRYQAKFLLSTLSDFHEPALAILDGTHLSYHPHFRNEERMHRIGLIVPHGFQLLSLAPMTVFEMMGFGLAKPPPAHSNYNLHLLSEHGGPIRSFCGLTVETEAFGDPAFDTIIVGVPFLGLGVQPPDASLGNMVGLVGPVFRSLQASPWRQAS
jgi:hypothetical protein